MMRWLGEHEKFRENYARAMEWRAEGKFDELDDVSDEACRAESPVAVMGLKLKADNIKWQLARMNAKKYGDRQHIEHGVDTSLADAIKAARERAGKK